MTLANLTLSLALGTSALTGGPRGFAVDVPAEARAAMTRASSSLVAGDQAAARAELVRVLETAPGVARAYELFAETLSAEQREAEARRYEDRARAAPNDPVAWFAVASLARDKEVRRAAIERVVALAPESGWGYYARARLATDESRYVDGLELFEKAIGFAPAEAAIHAALVTATQYYLLNDENAADAVSRTERARRAVVAVRTLAPGSLDDANATGAFSDLARGNELLAHANYFASTFPEAPSVGWAHNVVLADVRARDPGSVRARTREVLGRMKGLRSAFAGYWRDRIFTEYVLDSAAFLGPAALASLARDVQGWEEATPGILLALADACAREPATVSLAFKLYERGLALSDRGGDTRPYVVDRLRLAVGRAYAASGKADRAAALLARVATPDLAIDAAADLARSYLALGEHAKAFDRFVEAAAASPMPDVEEGLRAAARRTGRTDAEAFALVWARRDARARPAADFTLEDLDGNAVRLSTLRGKVVVLAFWFPTCAPCRAEFPHLQRLFVDLRARGLEVLAFDVEDDVAGARRFLEQKAIGFRSVRGSRKLARDLYGIDVMPTTVLIDRDGRVVFTHMGFDGERAASRLRREAEVLLERTVPR